jgi:hypothetical protein
MINITSKRITYKELKAGTYKDAYISQDDKFPVTGHLTSSFLNALIGWPDNDDDSKTFLYVFVDESNKEIGRVFLFGTRIRGGDTIYGAQTGCGLEVIEEYRGESIGAELLLFLSCNDEYNFTIAAGISQMILPMYRKLRYHLFEVPQYVKIQNSKYALKRYSLKGTILKVVSGLGNCLLKIMDIPNIIRLRKINKRIVIKKETIVPNWVSEMTANDGHKYMEVHDREWFQWNLDHNTNGYDEDIQSFYSVYDKNNRPLGFFMTKERYISYSGPKHGFITGTVVEWESCDKSVLSEADINLLALQTFSKKVDLILTLACESGTGSRLKKLGFVQRGIYYIGLKDKKKLLKDACNPNLWRLRFGYTNMVIM